MLTRRFITRLGFLGGTGGGPLGRVIPLNSWRLLSTSQAADSSSKTDLGKESVKKRDKVACRRLKTDLSKLSSQNIHDAVGLLRQTKWANFDETVEIAVNLGVDPRKPNQAIKVRIVNLEFS